MRSASAGDGQARASTTGKVDYIIVGAGSAGCVLASEIVARKLGSVLLIEAGSRPVSKNLKIPVRYPLSFSSQYSWQCKSLPQPELAQRRIPLPSGKTLGGSSSINGMIYVRGHADDFAEWNSIVGSDWSVDQVAVAFEATERIMYRGNLSLPLLTPISSAFLKNWSPRYPRLAALTTPSIGIGPFARCQHLGRRRSAWNIWIDDIFKRNKSPDALQVLTHTQVQQIVIEQQRAVGVVVASGPHENLETIRCDRGVLLCGGALNSPVTLIQSGIGPKSTLKNVGIETKVDSPCVGRHLQDHLVFPITYSLREPLAIPNPNNRDARWEYARNRSGPLISNIAEVGGFFSLGNLGQEEPTSEDCSLIRRPDFQWHVTPTHYWEYPTRDPASNAMSIGVTLLQPKSRGEVRVVRSIQDDSYGIEIDPAYHSNSIDEERLVDAVLWTRSLMQNGDMAGLLTEEILPGSKRQHSDQIRNAVRRWTTTIYHYAGSCSMGANDSVLDGRFRVRGVDGLWTCDASAMPTLVSANPQATVMMMAYRLANWLQESA